jgi:cephalosporin-C deacetylase-like acetyl esterase
VKKLPKKPIVLTLVALIITGTLFSGCLEEKTEKKEATFEDIAVNLMENLSEGNYEKAYNFFNSELKNSLSLEQLQTTWEYFTSLYGEFESIIDTYKTIDSGYDIVRLNCSFSNNYILKFRFVFTENKEINGFWMDEANSVNVYSAPAYVNQKNFTEYEITFGLDDWKLPGTISMPVENGPFPAVILVHGSGPNDRDETIGPNKPFKDIAWGLASNQIAVLRYEKRTKQYSDRIINDINLTIEEEVVDDAIAAFDFLKNYDKIDSENIIILGHSLGAMITPYIAALEQSISKIILLAPPARPLVDLIYNQTIYLAELDGIIDENESLAIQEVEIAIEKIKSLNFSDNEMIFSAYKAYWEYLYNFDQVDIAESLELPILILQGKRDYQVTFEDDFYIWNNTLNDKKNVLLISYSNLNHLFMNGSGPSTNMEYLIEGHVSSEVIFDIIDWII